MKYAILNPMNRVMVVADHKPVSPNMVYNEITNEEAATIAAAVLPDYYSIINGKLLNREQLKEYKKSRK
jgi:hypothetical protein